METKIDFLGIKFPETEVKTNSLENSVTESIESNLSVAIMLNTEDDSWFGIEFSISLTNKDFEMRVKAVAQFRTAQSMTEEFKESQFLTVNAPAIAFPYVRSYISNVTMNSGYTPITFPAVNFVTLSEK